MNVWFRRGLLSLLAVAVVSLSTAAFADVPALVDIDLRFTPLPSGGQLLEISTTAANDHVTRGLMEIETKGNFLAHEKFARPLTLVPTKPSVITLPFRANGGGDLGVIAVRVLDHATGEPIAVRVFHVGGSPEAGRVLTDAEVEETISRREIAHLRANAHAAAVGRIRELKASLRRPAAIEGRELTIEDEEWNRAVAEAGTSGPAKVTANSRLNKVAAQTCGVFDIESPNNHVYILGGSISFYDEYLAGTFAPGYGGHSIEVTTTVEYTDGCGATQLRSKTYGPVNSTTSMFSISNFKTSIASPNNPATRVAITFDSTGTATYQWNLTKGVQTLFNQADFPVDWSTGPGPTIRTSFTSTNSYALYYFRWNEGARRAEAQLNAEGFSPTFRAGYSSSITNGPAVAVTLTLPGLVAYGDSGKWVSRWVSSHEYGHLFQAYLQQAGNGGGVHSVCTPTDVSTAFDEGFADWHASRWDSQGRSYYFPNCTNSDCPPCSTAGYSVEGNVQAFFWDVFDSVNHTNDQGADTIWYPLSRLSDLDRPYDDFDDFYADWTSRGLWGSYQSVTDGLRPLCKVSTP